MGMFDKMTETAFREGKNGETIYLPHGVLGKGRVVSDPIKKKELFKFHINLDPPEVSPLNCVVTVVHLDSHNVCTAHATLAVYPVK